MTDETTYFTGRHPDGSALIQHHRQRDFDNSESRAWLLQGEERPILTYIALRLVRRAEKTPYFHLGGYMRRFWLFRHRLVSARIHHVLRSDNDRHMHDHPWWNISIVLRGGYWEHMPAGKKWRGPGSIVFRRPTARHWLELPPGTTTWSLFFMGRKQRDWGFHTERGWVHHRDYVDQFGERL